LPTHLVAFRSAVGAKDDSPALQGGGRRLSRDRSPVGTTPKFPLLLCRARGTRTISLAYPALKRWAIFCRASCACFSGFLPRCQKVDPTFAGARHQTLAPSMAHNTCEHSGAPYKRPLPIPFNPLWRKAMSEWRRASFNYSMNSVPATTSTPGAGTKRNCASGISTFSFC
jgi:hypothetical protein